MYNKRSLNSINKINLMLLHFYSKLKYSQFKAYHKLHFKVYIPQFNVFVISLSLERQKKEHVTTKTDELWDTPLLKGVSCFSSALWQLQMKAVPMWTSFTAYHFKRWCFCMCCLYGHLNKRKGGSSILVSTMQVTKGTLWTRLS